MSFDDVSKAWAAKELRNRSVTFSEVTSVYFHLEHGSCYGHEDFDYCYCDTGTWVEVIVHFLTTTSLTGRASTSFTYDDLGSLIKELTEWNAP